MSTSVYCCDISSHPHGFALFVDDENVGDLPPELDSRDDEGMDVASHKVKNE